MISKNADLMYPNQKQLQHIYDEGSNPHLYNYFCLHGKQIFLKRNRKVYSVVCRAWQPPKYVDEYKYSNGLTDFIYFCSWNIEHVMNKFNECCLVLLNSRYAPYIEKNPLITDTPPNEKEYDLWLV